jgi:bifunctional DNA-binding transcriptional regulator/antitoxin component of YhaV-PrlF toxin-antitoxin module
MPRKTQARDLIGRVGQGHEVVIPRKIFEKLQTREGDFVAFAQKENGVLINPKRLVDPDDVLTREEGALVSKARREMRDGKYVTLAQLEHNLAPITTSSGPLES